MSSLKLSPLQHVISAAGAVAITVSDTGPSLNDGAVRTTYSTGVGLANIRDRLAQAFGDRHLVPGLGQVDTQHRDVGKITSVIFCQ